MLPVALNSKLTIILQAQHAKEFPMEGASLKFLAELDCLHAPGEGLLVLAHTVEYFPLENINGGTPDYSLGDAPVDSAHSSAVVQ